MKETLRLVLLISALSLAGSACTQESTAASAGPAKLAKAGAPAAKPQKAGKVARIVFVDLEKCCACTRKRIDAAWKALTAVVGFPPVPDVERIHMDTQAAKAAPYKKQRAVMVPPAIYFYDKGNKLVEFLQGEVSEAKIRSVLK
jgi:hypothetical protein